MKKVLLTIAIILAMSSMASAGETPFEQGTIAIGGSLTPMMSEVSIDIGIMPKITYFISPNIQMGGAFVFDKMSYGDNDMTIFGIGPIFGYYFNTDKSSITGSLYPFIKAQLSYMSIGDDGEDVTFMVLGLEGGATYMLSERIGLDFSAHFKTADIEYMDDNLTNIGINAGFSAFIN